MCRWKLITDGACSKNNIGGVGLVILENNNKIIEYSNKYENCTNNLMELGAVIIGLRLVKKPLKQITIYTDSMYVIGCASKGWQRKKNKKMWAEFDNQLNRVKQLCNNIEFIHVKGHQSDDTEETKWNNYVDKLARKASQLYG